jgi:hypothetical protein
MRDSSVVRAVGPLCERAARLVAGSQNRPTMDGLTAGLLA